MSADDPIALCIAGRISAEVALARLLLAGLSPEQIASRLATSSPRPLPHSLGALARLLSERRDGIDRLARMAAASGLDHGIASAAPEMALARIRAAFDRAVAGSPEASVAAYSLGDPAILRAATAELVDWLVRQRLIGPARDVLDLGCGIGRVAAALAPRCRSVLGLDISPGMIAEARRRHGAANLRFEPTDGRDLSIVENIQSPPPGHGGAGQPAGDLHAGFDLVLAVDSFPYLMQAGVEIAERHVADAARLLRPGGALAILNVSYRGDVYSDRADAARWAADHGFRLILNGESPFTLWDGAAFLLGRTSADDC